MLLAYAKKVINESLFSDQISINVKFCYYYALFMWLLPRRKYWERGRHKIWMQNYEGNIMVANALLRFEILVVLKAAYSFMFGTFFVNFSFISDLLSYFHSFLWFCSVLMKKSWIGLIPKWMNALVLWALYSAYGYVHLLVFVNTQP